MKPLFLFDFDGVLAASLDVFEDIVKKSLVLLGHNFIKSRDDFLDLFRDNLYVSLAKKNISSDDLSKLFANIESGVDFSSIRLYPGIKDAIGEIGTIANIAIISSNREIQIEKILEANDAKKYFPFILGVDAGISKAEKIKKAISHFNADIRHTYYVVDTTGDLKEAKSAGVKSVAVGWGWHRPEELKEHRPDYFVENCGELVKLVVSLRALRLAIARSG